ncbi:MAG: TRIC cation channel family protein [Ignavibacteria bacterium]|nr:TRIC cation channel family protein [Ignavibacteria bacterium]MBK6419465.1 TRIC cation channel family protein [Ignavibacteria bacterium]
MIDTFSLPVWWDLTATFLHALVGTRFAIMRGYDVVGVLMISLIVSVGGGLLRDILLQAGPPVALRDPMYTAMAWGAAVVGLVLYKKVPRLQRMIDVVDALSIGLYGVYGAQKSMSFGLGLLGAIFVGVLNAIGGGILRDIIVRNEPEVFRPGTFYAVAAIVGVTCFVTLSRILSVDADIAAATSIGVTVTIRMLALRFGWKTKTLA